MKLFLKGERCYTPKCSIERRGYVPGQHGQGRKKVTPYGSRLREKQKLRRVYGVLEAQFRNTFAKAEKRRGITGEQLLSLLESRLDNVVFRLGLATSRNQARMLVTHRHIQVNGRTVNVPSFSVRPGDTVAVKEKSKGLSQIKASLEVTKTRRVPAWLEASHEEMRGKVLNYPTREEVDLAIQEQMVVEFYSR